MRYRTLIAVAAALLAAVCAALGAPAASAATAQPAPQHQAVTAQPAQHQVITHPYSITVSTPRWAGAFNCRYRHTTHYSNGATLEKYRGCYKVGSNPGLSFVPAAVSHPYDLTVSTPRWAGAFDCRYRHVTKYADGRVLEKYRGCDKVF